VAPPDPARAATGEWSLTQLKGRAVGAGKAPWIRIEDGGKVSGWAGVNQISSQLDAAALSRGEFKTSPIIATRMAGPPESMKVESDLLSALHDARTYSARSDALDLWDGSGHITASFIRKRAQ
jgi:heat shock protein HslJ